MPTEEEISQIRRHLATGTNIPHQIGTTALSDTFLTIAHTLPSCKSDNSASRPIRKSLSYVDLKREIQTILPICTNEDENVRRVCFGGRRQSKTFRQFPQIVVVPPESDNLTSSMPDIRKSVEESINDPKVLSIILNNVSDKNASCPDLTDAKIYQTPGIGSQRFAAGGYLESTGVLSNFSLRTNNEPTRTRKTNTSSVLESQTANVAAKRNGGGMKRKKRIETPTEVIKRNWKVKHSKSMHNLLKEWPKTRVKDQNYYTIHSADQFSRSMDQNLSRAHYYGSAERLANISSYSQRSSFSQNCGDYYQSRDVEQTQFYAAGTGLGDWYRSRDNNNASQRSRHDNYTVLCDDNYKCYNKNRVSTVHRNVGGCGGSCIAGHIGAHSNPSIDNFRHSNSRSFSHQNLTSLDSYAHYNTYPHYCHDRSGLSYRDASNQSMPGLACDASAHGPSTYRCWSQPNPAPPQVNWHDKGAWPKYLGAVSRCGCSRENDVVQGVVPIQEFLETYFDSETEETFEEMLNRQKAELNALMEAHRRQQLEYMGKYKRQKDRGDT